MNDEAPGKSMLSSCRCMHTTCSSLCRYMADVLPVCSCLLHNEPHGLTMAPMIILLLYQSWQNSREGLWQPEQAAEARSPPVQVPAAAQVQAPLHPLKAAWPSLQLQQQGRAVCGAPCGCQGCLAQPMPAPIAAVAGRVEGHVQALDLEPADTLHLQQQGQPESRGVHPTLCCGSTGTQSEELQFSLSEELQHGLGSRLGSITEEAFAQPVKPGQQATATAGAGRRKGGFRSLSRPAMPAKPWPRLPCG